MDPPVRFDISISHWPEYNNVAMVFSPQIDWIATEQEHVQNAFMIKIRNSQEEERDEGKGGGVTQPRMKNAHSYGEIKPVFWFHIQSKVNILTTLIRNQQSLRSELYPAMI